MAELIWNAPLRYYSQKDESRFFDWLQSIPEVSRTEGRGRQLAIHLQSSHLSEDSLRELIALYKRYEGYMSEPAQFAEEANASWFKAPNAYWYKDVFGGSSDV